MNREERIIQILSQALDPLFLEVVNESHMHSGNRHESHFKVMVVSQSFVGKSRVDRQRLVNDLLKPEFQAGLHALTQRTLAPEEWEAQKSSADFQSPNCHTKKP